LRGNREITYDTVDDEEPYEAQIKIAIDALGEGVTISTMMIHVLFSCCKIIELEYKIL